ncbi:hypothetical protein [Deefgea sp. CFH1-16]|uniref:hypothetical protein n=1 Tax=Deefgea sp. CFH1-16 TaxID=2675457 RepID=UPI0015F609D7|nr:hypothetical protein [Deefgea sp. CFH1-16]MBM5575805.1 hypothetical protein [Deefgea sp. CFH1-16]
MYPINPAISQQRVKTDIALAQAMKPQLDTQRQVRNAIEDRNFMRQRNREVWEK